MKQELEALRNQIEEESLNNSRLNTINASYHSDIKIHKRIENKLKKELEYEVEKRRQAEIDLEELRKSTEKVCTLIDNRNLIT